MFRDLWKFVVAVIVAVASFMVIIGFGAGSLNSWFRS